MMKELSQSVLKLILTVLIAMLFPQISMNGQTQLLPEEKKALVDSVASAWDDWSSVTLEGKLKMPGLPLTPSVKMYMERDSCIMISLRAPLFGEVGKAEITDSTILVVNKMKKVYVEESIDSLRAIYPGDLADLQEIFLGRISFPNLGLLSHDFEESIDVFVDEEGFFSLVTNDDSAKYEDVSYGYVVSPDYWPVALLVLPENKPDTSVTFSFDFFEEGYDLIFSYQSDRKNLRAVMEFNEPDWTGKPMDKIKLGSKYRRVDLHEFLHSF